MNQDGIVNSGDIKAIDQILAGTFVPSFPHSWKFYEEDTDEPFADISSTLAPYQFIGIKMGDVVTASGEEVIYITADDEVLNEGETYDIPFYLDRKSFTRAFGMGFISAGNKVEFISAQAPQLPDFDAGEYHIADDYINLLWLASPVHFNTGILIEPDEPFIILRMKANENIILHEAIVLGLNLYPEFVTPSPSLSYRIRLFWEGGIVSSTVDLADGRSLEFYPNPVTNEMHIKGLSDQDEGLVTIYNSLGQVILRTPLQETIDLTLLHEGMYYVSIFVDGKYAKAVPLVKIYN